MTTDTGKNSGYNLRARLRSFRYAFAGVGLLWHEPNARIHFVAAILVTAAGFLLNISSSEWIAVILCMGLVLALESVNTAIEALCDHVSPQFASLIKQAKDAAAAAVLIAAIAAVAVGVVIFIPKLYELIITQAP